MHRQSLEKLSRIVAKAHDRGELKVLLEGLLTPHELDEAMTRWQLLAMLEKGMTQRDISRQLSVSLGKIARGSRLLKYGPPEFQQLFRRIAADLGDL